MKKSRLLGAVCATVFSFISMSSHATLIPVLGGQAYYDDVADLTWLQNANAGASSVFDNGSSTIDGTMTWVNASNWAASLNINGVTGWRLPESDSTCKDYNCASSEFGNLFYNVLGNSAGSLNNAGPFDNILSNYYWSSTVYTSDTDKAWAFYFNVGAQNELFKYGDIFAWAVRPGGSELVPIPASVWLFGSGLLGLVSMARRKRTS